MSRVTSSSDLPQKEHFSLRLRLMAIMAAASVKEILTLAGACARCQGRLDVKSIGPNRISLIQDIVGVDCCAVARMNYPVWY
jgi:hypothetical protein